jgi:hypothetical protein
MLLGTYRLQDPNGFGHQIHGNRLIKANIRSTDEARKLWASSVVQSQLRRSNTKPAASDPENTAILERQLSASHHQLHVNISVFENFSQSI